MIGYDDTASGRDAVMLGRRLAELANASPILAAVFTWPQGMMTPDDLENAIEYETRGLFDWSLEALAGLEPVVRSIVDHSIAGSLIELAEAEGARLIVAGSTDRGPVARTLLGSTADSLLHGAPCGVAVAPRGYAQGPGSKLHKIAIAYDGSDESRAALRTGFEIGERLGCELTLVGVADYPRYGYAATWSVLTEGRVRDVEREARQEALEQAISRAPAGTRVEILLLTGSVGRTLAEVSGDFDLMIAGSRGYRPLHRTLLGSSTRHLLDSAACPVMVLPRNAKGSPFANGDAGDAAEADA